VQSGSHRPSVSGLPQPSHASIITGGYPKEETRETSPVGGTRSLSLRRRHGVMAARAAVLRPSRRRVRSIAKVTAHDGESYTIEPVDA